MLFFVFEAVEKALPRKTGGQPRSGHTSPRFSLLSRAINRLLRVCLKRAENPGAPGGSGSVFDFDDGEGCGFCVYGFVLFVEDFVFVWGDDPG